MLTFLNFNLSSIGKSINYLRENIFTEHVLFDITIFFAAAIIGITGFIFVYLFRKEKIAKRKNILQASIDNFIGEIAISESENELIQVVSNQDYQNLLLQVQHSKFYRKMLINELSETSRKFRGSTMTNVLWLFKKLDLEKQLLKNFDKKKWHKKAKIVQQISYLHLNSNIEKIFSLTNDRNESLRMEAQIAIVKMTGFDGLNFLDNVIYPISEWQQLRLIEELSSHIEPKAGNIIEWLKSNNLTVVNFALRLIEIYRQYDFYNEVAICLSHPSISICSRAVITISTISKETTADLLIAHYDTYNESTQITILKVLQVIGTENQFPFLLSILNHHDDTYKLQAVKAITTISKAGIEKIEKVIDKSLFPWNIILSQIKNVA
ncbi:MAG: HEAT repeat domain-containing protein [Ginsengibacter sp.]